MRTCGVLILIVWAAGVDAPAAAAQSSGGFPRARTSLTSVRAYVAAESTPVQLAAPSNVVVSDTYRRILESMLRGSPTFRRQCLRIAGEPLLTVYVGIAPASWPSAVRATTRVTRHANGQVSARVAIAPNADIVELMAHEFEHIIEQIDGIDLPALAALPRTGVHRQDALPGAFETLRAARVGRKVAGEFQRSS